MTYKWNLNFFMRQASPFMIWFLPFPSLPLGFPLSQYRFTLHPSCRFSFSVAMWIPNWNVHWSPHVWHPSQMPFFYLLEIVFAHHFIDLFVKDLLILYYLFALLSPQIVHYWGIIKSQLTSPRTLASLSFSVFQLLNRNDDGGGSGSVHLIELSWRFN